MGVDNLFFLELIEWFDDSGQEFARRFPKEGSGEIKYGAQMVVRESQAGIFFYNGKAVHVFGPGRHTLKTANIPILNKIMGIPWGLESPLRAGAYIAEIVRGAIQSINVGQTEAGRSIGLTRGQTMRYIIWPQAFKRMIPPLGNQFIISLKDTSLLMVIGVGELLRTGQEIVAVNFRAFEVYMAVAMVYLVMTMSIAKALKILETRLINRTSGKRA